MISVHYSRNTRNIIQKDPTVPTDGKKKVPMISVLLSRVARRCAVSQFYEIAHQNRIYPIEWLTGADPGLFQSVGNNPGFRKCFYKLVASSVLLELSL